MAQSNENSGGRKPEFVVYHTKEGKNGRSYTNYIGAGWEHRDLEGCNIKLDSLPLDGRLTLRRLREERMHGYEDERQA